MATLGETTVAIAGGGTGGHLIPGLAVAAELRARGIGRIVFIGTPRGVETRLVPAAGFDLHLINVSGLKNVGWRAAARALMALPAAILASRRILRDAGAGVVLGIGGYASGPALAAAANLKIPIVVMEVNAHTGLANRLAARWVRRAAVNFPATARDFPHAVVTGVPVRDAFFHLDPPLAQEPPVILAFGGSQGARAINDALLAAARTWNAKGWRATLIHQTGTREYNRILDAYRQAGLSASSELRVEVHPFIEDMAAAMARAELVISRSGASTLAELAAAGRPAILIPFPGAADQHQLRNARAYEQAGAAIVIEQAQLAGERLAAEVEGLMAAPARRAALAAAARGFARPHAAATIADLVLDAAGVAPRAVEGARR